MNATTRQYDLFRILNSEMKGELNSEFYSSFVRNIIRWSENSDEFESTSDILLKLKSAIDSMRDNLISELTIQGGKLPERTVSRLPELHPNLNDLLEINEVIARFGISRPTLYSWEKKGLIRTQVGGRVYFRISDINSFIDSQKNQ